MKLQLKTVSLFAFAMASAVVDVSVASAGPSQDPSQDTGNPGTVPGQLTGGLKLQLANKALTSAGLPILKVTLPPAQMKLTAQTTTNNGASIVYMGPGAWLGGYVGNPDGSFQLTPTPIPGNPNDYYAARVDMRFPAEVGKLYVVDCKISNLVTPGQQVQFWGLGAFPSTGPKSQVAEEAGHVLYSLQAVRTNEGVTVATFKNNHFSFHSCEITKLN